MPAEKIEVENVNAPGRTTRVDATMYQAARAALLRALPDAPPGLTQAETIDATKLHLPEDLFPGGAKAAPSPPGVDHDAHRVRPRFVRGPRASFRSAPVAARKGGSMTSGSGKARILGPKDGEHAGKPGGGELTPEAVGIVGERYSVDIDFEGTGPVVERHGLSM